jgi:hypothetical protein
MRLWPAKPSVMYFDWSEVVVRQLAPEHAMLLGINLS